jgi:uncharacterized membrane protein
MASQQPLHATANKNVRTVAELEQHLLREPTSVERIGEAVASYFGSLYFILAHVAVIAGWVAWNTKLISDAEPFDPFPFGLLSLLVGLEFILLTTFVLMNQKQQMRRTEQWGRLGIQLSMLTEQEVTKNIQMLHLICRHLGIKEPSNDDEVKDLKQATPVTAIADEIGKQH